MGHHMEKTKQNFTSGDQSTIYSWFGTRERFLDHVCNCQCHHIDFTI